MNCCIVSSWRYPKSLNPWTTWNIVSSGLLGTAPPHQYMRGGENLLGLLLHLLDQQPVHEGPWIGCRQSQYLLYAIGYEFAAHVGLMIITNINCCIWYLPPTFLQRWSIVMNNVKSTLSSTACDICIGTVLPERCSYIDTVLFTHAPRN